MRRYSIALAVSLLSVFACLSWTGEVRADSATSPAAGRADSTVSSAVGRAKELSVVFTGDILLDRGVRKVIERHGADGLFSQGVDAVFRSADVVVGNLECPATKVKAPVYKRFVFRAEPEWLPTLRRHGITHLCLANNHAIDQGRRGLTDTMQRVTEAGMQPVGGGATMEEAAQPVLLANKPRKVWLLTSLRLSLENFAYLPDRPSVSQEPMDSLVSRVERLRKTDADAVIVVMLHWGGEHTLRPVPMQRVEAHWLVDAGASIVVGHHTHTLQSIEEYRGRKIYYSIGNFIFDQQRPLNTRACMVRMRIKKTDFIVETIPVEIRGCVPYCVD